VTAAAAKPARAARWCAMVPPTEPGGGGGGIRGLLAEPAQEAGAVVDHRGEAVLRGEAVPDGEHDGAGVRGEAEAERVHVGPRARPEASSLPAAATGLYMRTRRLLALPYTASFQCTHGWRSRKVVGQNAGSTADRSNYLVVELVPKSNHSSKIQ